jgi:hypothetical protein
VHILIVGYVGSVRAAGGQRNGEDSQASDPIRRPTDAMLRRPRRVKTAIDTPLLQIRAAKDRPIRIGPAWPRRIRLFWD